MDDHNNPVPSSRRWLALATLSIALVMSMSTWFSASAVIPQLRGLWQLSSSTSAWLTIAVQLGFVAGAILSSLINLADIIPARYVIFGGAVGAAAANFLLGIAPGAGVGILLRFATGFFLAGVYPPAFKLISTWFKGSRGVALGVLAAAIVIGNGMPHLVKGIGGLEWKLVINVTSGITLLGGLITLLLLRDGPYPFPTATFDPRQIGLVFSNRGVRLATAGYVGHMWELFAAYAWFSAFAAHALSVKGIPSGSIAAYATFAFFVAGGLGCWLGGTLADRWGRAHTTMLMMAFSGTCALTIGLLLGGSLWIISAVALIWGFTIVADSAQFSTMVTELADQEYVGTALTLQLAAGFTVTVATIWLVPALVDWIGWRLAFALLAPGPLLGIWAMRQLQKKLAVDTAWRPVH
jgi:MFS family permease